MMSRYWTRISAAAMIAIITLAPFTAWADRIDGHWCHKDGRSLSIDGPEIVTPGGNTLRGLYDRHGFEYIVPAGEPGAGDKVVMVQRDDYLIFVWRGRDPVLRHDDAEHWHRCEVKTS